MQKLCIRDAALALLLCSIAIVLVASSANAQSNITPTARSYFSVTPVPFEQAQASLAKPPAAAQLKTATPLATPAAPLATSATPEIVELARALQNDPDLIYQYVHDNIEFSPLFGALKGPVGTLLDGRGNSFDQSALMVALLNQASLANPAISNVVFEYGQLQLTNAQLQSWLGVDSNPYSVAGVLAQGGIPATVFSDGSATVGHVWVKVSINGTPYVFDPAFKAHTWSTGIVSNLPVIMGYSQATFLADAGATVTTTTIQSVNRTQLRTDLTTYATNLAAYIRNSAPSAGIRDIVGGATITPTPFANGQTVRQSSNPYETGTPTDWTSIPTTYDATLSITIPGAAAQTYNSTDIYGHRLSIFFDASYVPTLYLDGTAVVSGTSATQGAQVGIALSISIPWATFANQSRTQYISAETNANGGSGGYVVQTGWDQVGRGMIEKHRKILRQAINSGAASNSELVLGESLVMLGYTWLAECAAQQRLSDQLLGTSTQYFYGGGIVGQAVGTTISSPYVDLPLNFINTPARVNGAATQTANSLAAFLDSSGTSSAFESASLEQAEASVSGFMAASTVKLLDIGIQNGDTIFDINNGNSSASQATYTSTIRPQLVPNYNPNDLAAIDSYVSQGSRVIAPLHGQIAIGSWTGVGFKTMEMVGTAFSYGEIISGGLSGGSGGVNVSTAVGATNTAAAQQATSSALSVGNPSVNSTSGSTGTVGDPLDHQKGSFVLKVEDLRTGPIGFPYGLGFERSYDSSAQLLVGPLGAGWTHNYAISAVAGSDGFSGMGQSSPLSAVNSIVALYVSSNLVAGQALTGQQNLESFALETVVNRWFTDQLTQNVVNVNQGWNSEQFCKVADGTYAPQLGSTAILDAPGGAFRYREKTGVTMNFNPSGQISSWSNAAGAVVNFTYAGSSLSAVSNPGTARQLTFTYTGSQISSVSDGVRSVSYTYAGSDLTSFTDVLGQNTTYAYDTTGQQDTVGHLTQIFYPSNPTNAFVTVYYDTLGRVSQQTDANGNFTQAFIAGSRTELDDPLGNRHVWYNDSLGDVTAEIQDYGLAPHLNITVLNTYDVQGNLLVRTMPEGDSIAYTYDALFNPVKITHTPKPGSTLSPLVESFTYVIPVSSLPNFEEVQTHTDANGNITTFAYDSTAGNLLQVSQPAVAKPGAGTLTPTQVFTYTSIGLPQTAQDAEGRVIRFDYNDTSHADDITTVTLDFGRLNLATQYAYDSFGDVNSITDANGFTTSQTFDAIRRLLQVNAPVAGVSTSYAYWPDGPVKTITRSSAVPEVTSFTYTLADKLAVVTDPLGNTVTRTYDVDDRLQTLTQQVSATQNRQRTFAYDALNRPVQTSDTTSGTPGQILETRSYTPNGLLLSFTDAASHAITYTYDGFDRLSQTGFPDSSNESYQRDANGNVLQVVTRSAQSISFTYDALNRVATKNPQGEAAGQVTYGYDLSGRLLQAADPSIANPYQIAYDTAGRAVSYTDQQGRNTTVGYDAVGNRTRLQWPANTNGTAAYFVTYQFDALNRMTEIDENGSSSTPLAKYQWDLLSRISLITYGDGTTDSYSQYDAADNLQTLTQTFSGGQSSVTFNYAWLQNHQRQSSTVNNSVFQYAPVAGTVSYGAADANNGYTSVNGVSVTYDGNRNLTFDGQNTLTYDVENRLVEAQNLTAVVVQFLYDPLGHRKQKQANGVTTQFVLAGNDEIADFAGTGVGTPLALTVRGYGGLPVAQVLPATAVQPETVAYYHHDVEGSTVAATQSGIASAEAYTYGEFGTPFAGGSLPYLFDGYRYDSETGLYYLNARYYSPELGRFLQADPIGIAGGANLYAYVGNDPINLADPLGTCANPEGCGVAGAINTIVTAVSSGLQWLKSKVGQGVSAVQNYANQAKQIPLQVAPGLAPTKRYTNTVPPEQLPGLDCAADPDPQHCPANTTTPNPPPPATPPPANTTASSSSP